MRHIVLALLVTLACISKAFSGSVLFSPYKDVTINMDWNTNTISTSVTGTRQNVVNVLPSTGANILTWAFASGSCGSESWAGVNATALAQENIKNFEQAGLYFIISTGGASGTFKCASDSGFTTFIERYKSPNLLGFDFDIEGGMSQSDVDSLVTCIKNAQSKYPNYRFSFTVATFGGSANPILGNDGNLVINAIKSVGLSKYIINLMAMDYGSATATNCVINSATGLCDMGKSAVQAATSLHNQYGIPYNQIELTPMIGGNDTPNETFTLSDVDVVSSFALQNGLAGVHHWSLDRDVDCAAGYASPTCNSYGQAGTLGFTKRFVADLGGSPIPTPVSSPTLPPSAPVNTPTASPKTSAPTQGGGGNDCKSRCAASGCKGCLWTYSTGNTCFPDYPQVACEAAGSDYCWC